MRSEPHSPPPKSRQAAPHPGAARADLVRTAFHFLRGLLPPDGETLGAPAIPRQNESLREWARGLGLLLEPAEIDAWFGAQGFHRITHSAYYRAGDNLGVFDAHDKNVIRAGEVLVPFDVIPCHPAGGFLKFIEDTLTAGHTLKAVRTVTTPRP